MNKQPLLTKNDLKKICIILLDGIFLGTIIYVCMYLLVPDHMKYVYLLAVISAMAGISEGNILSSIGLFKIVDKNKFKKDKEVNEVKNEVDVDM